jgi:hypothetical protein
MRKFILVTTLTAGLIATAPRAGEPAEAIRGVISGQIDAFRADDFATAFTFASPTIKRLFGTSERFGEMVRSGYPMVWRPADVRFSGLRDRGGRMVQDVLVIDQAGAPHVLEYEMIETEGGWQINGVRVRRAGDAGV